MRPPRVTRLHHPRPGADNDPRQHIEKEREAALHDLSAGATPKEVDETDESTDDVNDEEQEKHEENGNDETIVSKRCPVFGRGHKDVDDTPDDHTGDQKPAADPSRHGQGPRSARTHPPSGDRLATVGSFHEHPSLRQVF